MTQVLRSPPQLPSSASSPISFSSNHDSQALLTCAQVESGNKERIGGRRQEEEADEEEEEEEEEGESTAQKGEVEGQLPVLAFILAVLKKVRCRSSEEVDGRMEIGWPTDVRHVAHVTFDRFHGFLGLPVEFEPEVPRRAPSASFGVMLAITNGGATILHDRRAKVFGVSAESMQCSFDYRGNSVPTILLLMQSSLYEQGGLKAEGIFRINGENSQEEYVRDQLNRGVVPDGIDVHCLAGLIKAWFRELPAGVLDSLSPEQVMLCQTEEDCGQLATSLPPTEASLLNWAINLMADVVQEEHENKMNARNIAVVFAPNMTQMADPLTALMYAVQVMNFLKMLILKTLKERQELALEDSKAPPSDPPDKNDLQRFELRFQYEEKTNRACVSENGTFNQEENSSEDALAVSPSPCKEQEELAAQGSSEAASTPRLELAVATEVFSKIHANSRKNRFGQAKNSSNQKKSLNFSRQPNSRTCKPAEKLKGADSVSRIISKTERFEAWR